MAIVTTDNKHYADIADAIRSKGVSGNFTPAQMAGAIESIPSGADITDGVVATARNANGYITSVDKYGVCGPYEFHYASGSNRFQYLTTVTLKNETTAWQGAFQNASITSILGIENLTALGLNTFYGSHISSLNLSSVTQITGDACFRNATTTEILLPVVTTTGSNAFQACTSLQRVQLGSVGHTLATLDSNVFFGCTQANLTIGIYTTGANVDAFLQRIRAGATNATIIIKASEATIYNGVSYAAGDTMITSEVA